MRFIEGLTERVSRFTSPVIRVDKEPDGEVIGRHLAAMGKLDARHTQILARLNTGCTQGYVHELGLIIDEEIDRMTGGLNASRALVLLGGRFRLPYFPATI